MDEVALPRPWAWPAPPSRSHLGWVFGLAVLYAAHISLSHAGGALALPLVVAGGASLVLLRDDPTAARPWLSVLAGLLAIAHLMSLDISSLLYLDLALASLVFTSALTSLATGLFPPPGRMNTSVLMAATLAVTLLSVAVVVVGLGGLRGLASDSRVALTVFFAALVAWMRPLTVIEQAACAAGRSRYTLDPASWICHPSIDAGVAYTLMSLPVGERMKASMPIVLHATELKSPVVDTLLSAMARYEQLQEALVGLYPTLAPCRRGQRKVKHLLHMLLWTHLQQSTQLDDSQLFGGRGGGRGSAKRIPWGSRGAHPDTLGDTVRIIVQLRNLIQTRRTIRADDQLLRNHGEHLVAASRMDRFEITDVGRVGHDLIAEVRQAVDAPGGDLEPLAGAVERALTGVHDFAAESVEGRYSTNGMELAAAAVFAASVGLAVALVRLVG